MINISNFNRLINLFIIIIIWACITEILKILIETLNLRSTISKISIYIIVLICVLSLNYHMNGDILVDEMYYKKLEYQENNKNKN